MRLIVWFIDHLARLGDRTVCAFANLTGGEE